MLPKLNADGSTLRTDGKAMGIRWVDTTEEGRVFGIFDVTFELSRGTTTLARLIDETVAEDVDSVTVGGVTRIVLKLGVRAWDAGVVDLIEGVGTCDLLTGVVMTEKRRVANCVDACDWAMLPSAKLVPALCAYEVFVKSKDTVI